MQIVIRENLNATVFEYAEDWKIEKSEITGHFNVLIYTNKQIVGILPYNVKSTVILIDYGYFDDPEPREAIKA